MLYGTQDDLRASLDLLASVRSFPLAWERTTLIQSSPKGTIKPFVGTAPLDNVNDILNGLKANTVKGRMVVLPNGAA